MGACRPVKHGPIFLVLPESACNSTRRAGSRPARTRGRARGRCLPQGAPRHARGRWLHAQQGASELKSDCAEGQPVNAPAFIRDCLKRARWDVHVPRSRWATAVRAVPGTWGVLFWRRGWQQACTSTLRRRRGSRWGGCWRGAHGLNGRGCTRARARCRPPSSYYCATAVPGYYNDGGSHIQPRGNKPCQGRGCVHHVLPRRPAVEGQASGSQPNKIILRVCVVFR
jgi:hypothetical protein